MQETAEDQRESEAVTNARQRIAQLAETHGTRHPDYATGLNQLALLLIMQGSPESAEPLLRTALEIRRESLGERHPDFATNLSSLGGLLWARGELDQAEPLLRQAVEVRCHTLGPAHPKSVVSMNSLEQLLKARRDWTGRRVQVTPPSPPPTAPPARVFKSHPVFIPPSINSPPPTPTVVPSPVVRAPEPVVIAPAAAAEPVLPEVAAVATPVSLAPRPSAGTASDLQDRLDEVTRRFAALGDHLTQSSELLRSGGVPVLDDLSALWGRSRDGFGQVLHAAKEAASELGVAIPSDGLNSLQGVSSLVPVLREAESARGAFEALRRSALAVLDQVNGLSCPSEPGFVPLAACLENARSLRTSIEAAPANELPADVAQLNTGTHPLTALLKLVEVDESADDTKWADWYDLVAASFGNPLAVAVARARVVSKRS